MQHLVCWGCRTYIGPPALRRRSTWSVGVVGLTLDHQLFEDGFQLAVWVGLHNGCVNYCLGFALKALMHSAKPAGTASADTVDSFARDSHILHRPGMPIKTRDAHQDQGCPSRPGVPVKTRGARQDQGCPSRPGVPIKTRGAHQDSAL